MKAARPRVAEKPQKNVAAPIYKNPRNELRLSDDDWKAFDPRAGRCFDALRHYYSLSK